MSNSNIVRSILAQAAIASGESSRLAMRTNDKRAGAYTLYVQAACEAGSAEVLNEASDSLFAEIRQTGKVCDSEGRGHSVNAKRNKDGSGFLIPSAISSAKSVLTDALVLGIPVADGNEPRTFTEIRKDVQSAKEEARRATLTGDEAIRADLSDMLAELASRVSEASGSELADLYRAVYSATGRSESDSDKLAKAA